MDAPPALVQATFPEPVLEVLRRLAGAGHRSWLVGGAVRDLLLHLPREAVDFDVATPATPREVMALFRRVIPTGVEHGTVTVLVDGDHQVEVTTFRGEGTYEDGRRPASVTFHTDLEADLARRDFTMNAMAYDPLDRIFRDPFGGREDMRRRRIRAVGDPAERFGEDGLRPMRAARFAAQLGYELETSTRAAIAGALEVVRRVSVERIAEELGRLAVAPHAAEGLRLLEATGLLEAAVPSLAGLPPAAFAHAVAVVHEAPPTRTLRFAALLHLLGPAAAEGVLMGLRLPRRLSDDVRALVGAHACRWGGREAALPVAPADVRRWLAAVGPERAPDVLALADAEIAALPASARHAAAAAVAATRGAIDAVRAAAPPLSARELALDGRAVMQLLGAGPGAVIGEALRHLLDRVLADPALNTREGLEAELRRWWAARGGRL